jgi:hypothetical protein
MAHDPVFLDHLAGEVAAGKVEVAPTPVRRLVEAELRRRATLLRN